jgi:ATP-binding cassette subfamily F protein 3
LSYAEQKERNRQIRRAEKAVAECEELIFKLEEDISKLEDKLSTPEGAADSSLFTLHADLRKQLNAAVTDWEKKSMELEKLQG